MEGILLKRYPPHLKDQGDRAADMVLRLGRNLLVRKVIQNFQPPAGCLMRQKDIELVASLVELTGGQCCDDLLVKRLYAIMLKPNSVSEGCLGQVVTSLSKISASQTLLKECD